MSMAMKTEVSVVCNQTGKSISSSTDSLSKADGEPLTEKDIDAGTLNYNGKDYPVPVIKGNACKLI